MAKKGGAGSDQTLMDEIRRVKQENATMKIKIRKLGTSEANLTEENFQLKQMSDHLEDRVQVLEYELKESRNETRKFNNFSECTCCQSQDDQMRLLKERLASLSTRTQQSQKSLNVSRRKIEDLINAFETIMMVQVTTPNISSQKMKKDCGTSHKSSATTNIVQRYNMLSFQNASILKQSMLKYRATKKMERWQTFLTEYIGNIYVTAGNEMLKKYYNVIQTCRDIFSQPVSFELYKDTSKSREHDHLSDKIKQYVLDCLRDTADQVDVDCLVMDVLYKSMEFPSETTNSEGIIQAYDPCFKALSKLLDKKYSTSAQKRKLFKFAGYVCSLAWEMTLQNPPMWWDIKGLGDPADESTQIILPSRDMDFTQLERMTVRYYLEPTLMQNDQVLQKGRVVLWCCENQSEDIDS